MGFDNITYKWLNWGILGEVEVKMKIAFNRVVLLCVTVALSGCGVDYQFKQAQKLESKGEWQEAVAAYRKIQEKYPEKGIEARLRVASVFQQQGRFDEALAEYGEVGNNFKETQHGIQVAEGYANTHYARGEKHRNAKDYQKAFDDYIEARAFSLDPDFIAKVALSAQAAASEEAKLPDASTPIKSCEGYLVSIKSWFASVKAGGREDLGNGKIFIACSTLKSCSKLCGPSKCRSAVSPYVDTNWFKNDIAARIKVKNFEQLSEVCRGVGLPLE